MPAQSAKLNAAKMASARAAPQTLPRQKRSLPRKVERATKPAKYRIVLRSSRAMWIYEIETKEFVSGIEVMRGVGLLTFRDEARGDFEVED